MNGIFYMSFVNDAGFAGALFVRGDTITDALVRSHLLKLNPGGEAQFVKLPDAAVAELPASYIETLLSKQELAAFDERMGATEW